MFRTKCKSAWNKKCTVCVVLENTLLIFFLWSFQVGHFHHVGMNEVLCFSQALKILLPSMVRICWTKNPVTLICSPYHPSKSDSMAPTKTREPSAARKGSCRNPAATCLDDHLAVKWSNIENLSERYSAGGLSRDKLSLVFSNLKNHWRFLYSHSTDDLELKITWTLASFTLICFH